MSIRFLISIFIALIVSSCALQSTMNEGAEHGMSPGLGYARSHLHEYARAPMALTIDSLPQNQQLVISHLVKAATLIDDLYWYEIYGDREVFMGGIQHSQIADLASIQYGPWDRFADNHLFVDYARQRPPGANFYPFNMTREEIIESKVPKLESPYTIIRRTSDNQLQAVYYHDAFALQINEICKQLELAAKASTDENFSNYLRQRIIALQTDSYWESEMFWMDLRNNPVNLIIGPMSEKDDHLLHVKKAHAASILLRDAQTQKEYDLLASQQERLLNKISRELKQPLTEQFRILEVDVYQRLMTTGRANLPNREFLELYPTDERVELEKGQKMILYHNISELVLDSLVIPMVQNTMELSHWNQVDQSTFEKIHTLRKRMVSADGLDKSEGLPGINDTEAQKLYQSRNQFKQLLAYYITYQLLGTEQVIDRERFATTLITELLYAMPDFENPSVEGSVLAIALEQQLLKSSGRNQFAVKSENLDGFLGALKGRIADSLDVMQQDVQSQPKPMKMPDDILAFFEEVTETTSPKRLVVITPQQNLMID